MVLPVRPSLTGGAVPIFGLGGVVGMNQWGSHLDQLLRDNDDRFFARHQAGEASGFPFSTTYVEMTTVLAPPFIPPWTTPVGT